jgi:hypothetical protein
LPLLACAALAQDVQIDPRTAYKINLPPEGPVSLISADWGQSRATARGGATQVDLHSTLMLRNTSNRRIRGVSLLVLAQDVTPGGKASVTVPSLDVQPGESFPIRLDLRLMRPLSSAQGPLVEVGVDGVLFDDLTFYGPNKLNARRAMLAWEMEARRDRKALAAALESGGPEGLRKQLLSILSRQAEQPQGSMQVARSLPATNAGVGKTQEFAFLKLPEAPVELVSGSARMTANEASAPRVEVQSKSKRPIRYVELAWLVRETDGHEYLAGTLPSEISLAAGQRATVQKENVLRFPREVSKLTAFPVAVEFADGEMWIPSRQDLRDPRLAAALPVSGEEQRLAELYRRKGLDAVVQQLKSMR